ncbi:hypothetical protein EDC56_2913 [Sinobacterium caligoides]|uniref:Uncharacterized protein n=1 Tax=Sinobacterium caligoides TaxID=933926 RepID=A0A3N2DLQ3_9GAMM|nr:hypothetical protein [Sinobacterium caligoides]ROS00275.1 hypothetical protein EDC56_2913 [Sinobacterium caligoides]
MDTATMLWGLLFSSIGLGYFIYGKKQSHTVARYTGITLMIYPYFIFNTIALVTVGTLLLLVPRYLKL